MISFAGSSSYFSGVTSWVVHARGVSAPGLGPSFCPVFGALFVGTSGQFLSVEPSVGYLLGLFLGGWCRLILVGHRLGPRSWFPLHWLVVSGVPDFPWVEHLVSRQEEMWVYLHI